MTSEKIKITVETSVKATIEKVWKFWTGTEHIVKWNNASDDWHTPKANHDLKPGGDFIYRMEAKDGSFGFDFGGSFDVVIPNDRIEYTLGDGRKVKIIFSKQGDSTHVAETFEAENVNTIDLQKGGWQAILNNFKKYTEAN